MGRLLLLGSTLILKLGDALGELLSLLDRQILGFQGLFQGLLNGLDLALVLPAILGQELVQVILAELGDVVFRVRTRRKPERPRCCRNRPDDCSLTSSILLAPLVPPAQNL